MFPALLNWSSAALLAAGLAASQILLGGWWYPALAAPGYLLAGAAAVLAGLAFGKTQDAPGAWCTGSVLLFTAYLFWRQAASPDAYAARADAWLVLGALAVYLTAAWQLRGDGPRWIVLGAIFALSLMQVAIVLLQFTAASAFHPLAEWVPTMRLPTGQEELPHRGFVSGTLASRGTLSSVLQASTFFALGLLLWGRVSAAVRLLLIWVTAAGFAGLVLTLSRAAYLGMTFGLVVFALLSFFVMNRGAVVHRFWLIFGALLLTVLPLFVALLVGTESVLVRFRLDELGGDAWRESLWFTVVPPMLKLDPWFGVGANLFDQLSLRYRAGAFEARPVHAHNDWLQLLVEYGRIGLALGVSVFILHFAAAWRNALRLARESSATGWWPQSMELGLLTGSLAALTAQGVHSFFDYRLHVAATALLVALAAGWIAGARLGPEARRWGRLPMWLRAMAVLPALPGAVLVWWVMRDGPAERYALLAENARALGDAGAAAGYVHRGMLLQPGNPALLDIAAANAGAMFTPELRLPARGLWISQSADFGERVILQRPGLAAAVQSYALAETYRWNFEKALPFHLRGIALDPDAATGYEFLAWHFAARGQREEALRLFRLARRLPWARSGTPQSTEELDQALGGSNP